MSLYIEMVQKTCNFFSKQNIETQPASPMKLIATTIRSQMFSQTNKILTLAHHILQKMTELTKPNVIILRNLILRKHNFLRELAPKSPEICQNIRVLVVTIFLRLSNLDMPSSQKLFE